MPTIAVDFDGVINPYRNGFQGRGVFEDPAPECAETLRNLELKNWTVIINTCRSEENNIRRYLCKHGIPFDFINYNPANDELGLSPRKVLADVYLDDRAITFNGSWKGMYHQIINKVNWYQRPHQTPYLPMEVCGYRVDQIALYVPSVVKAVEAYRSVGYDEWVLDKVHAKDGGGEFKVQLAFNYQMMPVEFELLELLEGSTAQLAVLRHQIGLSHFGFHVDNMDGAINQFVDSGFNELAHIETISHSCCPYLYEYAYCDTSALGFISKLIKRRV